MNIIQIIDAFTFYGLDVILLATTNCALVQILKVTIFKKCQKKVVTFLPFFVGGALYAAYSALINLNFSYVVENYLSVLEHGFSVGALSTVVYVWYEQFVREKKSAGATAGVIKTLIDGYVPDDAAEKVAEEIARAIECDVLGDGAKKTADILAANSLEEVDEKDIALLSKLVIETLAHISTGKNKQ